MRDIVIIAAIALLVTLVTVYYRTIDSMGYSISNLSGFAWMVLFIIIPLVLVPAFVYNVAKFFGQEIGKKKLYSSLQKAGFNPDYSIDLNENILLIDGNTQQLCIAYNEASTNGEYRYYIYPANRILTSAVISDNEEVTSASTSSTVGRAIVGGLIFGGAGAIVGGLSTKKVEKKLTSSLELKIIVDDSEKPGHRISFFFNNGTQVGASTALIREVEKWQVLVELLMTGIQIPAARSATELQDFAESVRLKSSRAETD